MASVDRGTAGHPAKAPTDRRCKCTAARTLQLPGIAPGTARRETPINTATTCGADSTTISNDADFDVAPARRLVRIREIGSGDGDVVDEVFAGLSPYSRYLRFQAPVAELSAATRRSLTALDGRTHVALAAFSQGRPIGIVRMFDLGDGRGELAVEVIDGCQGRGVGNELLQAARNRAAELGYRELVGEMLVVNAAALAALRRVFAVVRVRRDGSELTVTMPVDGEPAPAHRVERLVA
jgi:GNAT superfamily N-acetyltransferase